MASQFYNPLPAYRLNLSQQPIDRSPPILQVQPHPAQPGTFEVDNRRELVSQFSPTDLVQAWTEQYEEVENKRNEMWNSSQSQAEQDGPSHVHLAIPYSHTTWRSPPESATTTPSDGYGHPEPHDDLPPLITGDAYAWMAAGPGVLSQESGTLVSSSIEPSSSDPCELLASSLSICDDAGERTYEVFLEAPQSQPQFPIPSISPVIDSTAHLSFHEQSGDGLQDDTSDFQLEDYDDDDGGSVYEGSPPPSRKRRPAAKSSLSRLRDPVNTLSLNPSTCKPGRAMVARSGESSSGPRCNRPTRAPSPKKGKMVHCNYNSPFHDSSRPCNSFKSPYDMLRHVRDIHGLDEAKLVNSGVLDVLDARAYLAAVAYELKNNEVPPDLRRQAITVGKKLGEEGFHVEEYQLFIDAAVAQLPSYGMYSCPTCKLTFAVKRSMERHKRNKICQKKSAGQAHD